MKDPQNWRAIRLLPHARHNLALTKARMTPKGMLIQHPSGTHLDEFPIHAALHKLTWSRAFRVKGVLKCFTIERDTPRPRTPHRPSPVADRCYVCPMRQWRTGHNCQLILHAEISQPAAQKPTVSLELGEKAGTRLLNSVRQHAFPVELTFLYDSISASKSS